jgi:hypothetical protein
VRQRRRVTGWSSAAPRVVGERSIEADYYDQRPARTWVPRRKWFRVPEGPWPCEICGEFLTPGVRAHRRITGGEAFYRHPTCGTRAGGNVGIE